MARYKHLVRKTTEIPELRLCNISVCFNGFYRINLTAHGFSVGDVLYFSGFGNNYPVNGTHTVTNENLSANAFNIDVVCIGSPNIGTGYVQVPNNTNFTEVFPLGFYNAKFNYELQEGEVYYIRKLSEKLIFTNRPSQNIFDFNYFYNSELDSNGLVLESCNGYQYIIQKECNGVFEDYYEGKFSLNEGEWDIDNCIFSVELSPNENYNCLLNNKIVNILDASTAITTLYENGSNPDRDYVNTRLFSSVIQYLVAYSCPTLFGVISDFFQINPINASTINYVSGEVNPYTLMTVGAATDVREPIPSTLKSFVNIKFSEFMDDLKSIFNVYYIIENNYVRIEHISYFENTNNGLDLTQSKYDKYKTGRNKYTFLEVPRTETLVSDGREYLNIFYENDCSLINQSDSKVENSLITTVPRTDGGGDDKGVVLFSTTYDGGSGKYVVIGSINNQLRPPALFLKFHRHNLEQQVGSLRTLTQTLYEQYFIYTSKKNKLQDEIKIPFCCGDEFDVYDKILTDLGNGTVDTATLGNKDDVLTLKLKYGHDPVLDITSPNDIDGCDLLLDAALGVTIVSGAVSVWEDQSGNGRHATQSNATLRPTQNILPGFNNGLPTIRFDGVDDGMYTSAFQTFPNKRGSVFIVFRNSQSPFTVLLNDHLVGTYGSGAGNMWDIITAGDGSDSKFITSAQGGGILLNVAIAPISFSDASFGYTDFILFSAIRNTDTNIVGIGNGNIGNIASTITPGSLTVSNVVPDINPVNIGNSFITGNSDPFKGDIAEIVIYNRDLSDYERQQMEMYFFKKYALFQYT